MFKNNLIKAIVISKIGCIFVPTKQTNDIMKTTITNSEFDLFLNSCEIFLNAEQSGHSTTDYDMKGYMNDSEGIRIATIDFVKGTNEVEKEIYIDDETCFSPSVIQEERILDAIDKATSIERERWVDEFLNQETY